MKPETVDDTLKRIAKQELGLLIDTKNKVFIGQFTGPTSLIVLHEFKKAFAEGFFSQGFLS
jgi:hypothetical protein